MLRGTGQQTFLCRVGAGHGCVGKGNYSFFQSQTREKVLDCRAENKNGLTWKKSFNSKGLSSLRALEGCLCYWQEF